ncbi:MAG: cellulase family glycosylhydrolase [Labilibaculum sp.]|nr:cellulase family glycosylhydrolase [Labilibaculum sp.]MBI9059821.1 cellulase family glycosylhydrolase [Labilibaculum sp.]
MKLHHMLLSILIGLMVFGGCSKNETSVDPELVVSVDKLDISKAGETKTIHVKSNVDWTIESSESWCNVTPTSGGAATNPVQITIEANTSTDERSAILTVKADDLIKEIPVVQAPSYVLLLKQSTFSLDADAQEISIEFQTSGTVEIAIDGDWITKKEVKSIVDGSQTFTISANESSIAREGSITFTLDDITEIATVNQEGVDVSIPADNTGVESNAMTLAGKMIAGWNIGNSMEVPGGETGWGNPVVSKQLIDGVKAAGFNAIRIPCAWDGYITDQEVFKVSDIWFARVKEVVDYCYENEMYAILNIHWDGGWLENNPTSDKQEEVNKEQYALWQQIAVYFRDYDERLLFAGTNEVHADYGTPSTENITVQQSFNQSFVDAVRSTGGKNAYRNLVVQTYNTNIAHGVNFHEMPTDEVADRLMLEVHYYDPWDFCGQEESGFKTQWGNGYTDVSSYGQEDDLNEQFGSMKTNYSDKGIPVILGEYGAMLRADLTGDALTTHIESRNYYLKTVTHVAKANGMIPFIWDNGATGNNSFGLFDRSTGNEVHSDAIDAIIEGATN